MKTRKKMVYCNKCYLNTNNNKKTIFLCYVKKKTARRYFEIFFLKDREYMKTQLNSENIREQTNLLLIFVNNDVDIIIIFVMINNSSMLFFFSFFYCVFFIYYFF